MPTSNDDSQHPSHDNPKALVRARFLLHRQPHRPDRMEHIVEEARSAGMLHGKLGRLLLGNYEGYKESTWLQRAGVAVIGTTIICISAVLLKLPGIVYWPIFVAGFLIAGVCWLISMGHLVRWLGYAYHQTPEERKPRWWDKIYDEPTVDNAPPGEDNPDGGTEDGC